jgi:hypothetical protein
MSSSQRDGSVHVQRTVRSTPEEAWGLLADNTRMGEWSPVWFPPNRGQSGATLAELMARLGHSTPQAALRYQHAAQGRDAAIAARMSELAGGSPRP